ncbi:MAG: hypothetical protein KKF62_18505 [Bacteroidetes bacterium]|nr:hypothetical protein [Bacteroidota bacterium]MBU1114376.1 hypothetical protein [Bacteroidota bacterium]MBU1798329.1 hypothetical protein [Bacteroidota bacterium]
MFDTIGTYYHTENALNTLRYISVNNENIDRHTGEIATFGTHKNLRIKVMGNSVSINGSLPKYLFGDNVQELTRKHTQEAIESLSDELHLQLDESKPYRIDVASNFIMKEPLVKYYSALESLARYEKKTYRDGFLFTTNKIALEFYDKNKELQKKKQLIPEIFQNRNVLRYEIHLQKRLPEIFKQDILAKDLYDADFYIKAVDIWKERYFSIKKNRVLTLNSKVISIMDSKTIFNQLALLGLEQVGQEKLLKMLEYERTSLSKMQFKRIKEKINSISELPVLTEQSNFIQELDSKIIQRARYYR